MSGGAVREMMDVARVRWRMVGAIVAAVLACGWAQAQSLDVYSAWLSASAYQRLFDQQVAKKLYPVAVWGRNERGERQFRARFVPNPGDTFLFESRSGMSAEAFTRRNDDLAALGYTLIHEQRFTDAQGIAVQAVWTKLGKIQSDPGERITGPSKVLERAPDR